MRGESPDEAQRRSHSASRIPSGGSDAECDRTRELARDRCLASFDRPHRDRTIVELDECKSSQSTGFPVGWQAAPLKTACRCENGGQTLDRVVLQHRQFKDRRLGSSSRVEWRVEPSRTRGAIDRRRSAKRAIALQQDRNSTTATVKSPPCLSLTLTNGSQTWRVRQAENAGSGGSADTLENGVPNSRPQIARTGDRSPTRCLDLSNRRPRSLTRIAPAFHL